MFELQLYVNKHSGKEMELFGDLFDFLLLL